MIDAATLVTYLAVVAGFVFIPGPATLLTLARASTSGTRVGIATGLGIAAGDIIHTLLAVAGISAIVMTSATAFMVLKYAGAAYLIYLGIRAILAPAAPMHAEHASPSAIGAATAFRQAILTEVLNPKSALFFLSFLPQFVRPENGAVTVQLMLLGALFVALGLVSTVCVALCAGHVGTFLRRHPVAVRWQGKVVGGIYCALGLRLAMQER